MSLYPNAIGQWPLHSLSKFGCFGHETRMEMKVVYKPKPMAVL